MQQIGVSRVEVAQKTKEPESAVRTFSANSFFHLLIRFLLFI